MSIEAENFGEDWSRNVWDNGPSMTILLHFFTEVQN